MSVTHYNNELGEVVEYDVYEMLDPPQCLAEMTPLGASSTGGGGGRWRRFPYYLKADYITMVEDIMSTDSLCSSILPKLIHAQQSHGLSAVAELLVLV